MATSPSGQRSPAPPISRQSQPKPPGSAIGAFGSALGTVAIAVGVGVLGAYMLDLHTHMCEGCGNRWRHLGAFNIGDPVSHTCRKCGTVQWWKDGVPHVFRSALRLPPMTPAATIAKRLQEIREVSRPALRFGTPATSSATLSTALVPHRRPASAMKENPT